MIKRPAPGDPPGTDRCTVGSRPMQTKPRNIQCWGEYWNVRPRDQSPWRQGGSTANAH